jgi:hypothetical protein
VITSSANLLFRVRGNFEGYTPLHYAVHYENHGVVKTLLEEGKILGERPHDAGTWKGKKPMFLATTSKGVKQFLSADLEGLELVDRQILSRFKYSMLFIFHESFCDTSYRMVKVTFFRRFSPTTCPEMRYTSRCRVPTLTKGLTRI